ncbi:hypothetical protein HJFPF1_08508 [Paramyrothecium foliicola]|nr:hypothetical protein HJFPF1_08508 [Paramyrothecium foliicola]
MLVHPLEDLAYSQEMTASSATGTTEQSRINLSLDTSLYTTEPKVPITQPSPTALVYSTRKTYSKIYAIVLHWENEYLDSKGYGPAQEAKKLVKACLKWGWHAKEYVIPNFDSLNRINEFLTDLTSNMTGSELLLCYYVGHGGKSSNGPAGKPFHIAQMSSKYHVNATIDWPIIRAVLEAAQCDVAMLLNCCHGEDAWVSRKLEHDKFTGPPGKIMCILAATRKDELAYSSELNSFGTLLKYVLKKMRSSSGPPNSFSMSMLLEALKLEIARSRSFVVLDNLRGGVVKPMDPSLHNMPTDSDQIWLHRTYAIHMVARALGAEWRHRSRYRPLAGPAGEYWRREV